MNSHVSSVHVIDYEIEIKDKVTNTEIDSKSKEDISATEKIKNENGKLIMDKSDTSDKIPAKKNRRKQILKPCNSKEISYVFKSFQCDT